MLRTLVKIFMFTIISVFAYGQNTDDFLINEDPIKFTEPIWLDSTTYFGDSVLMTGLTGTGNHLTIDGSGNITKTTITNETSPASFVAAYNGKNIYNDALQRIGLAFSTDGIVLHKSINNPIIDLGAGGSFNDNGSARPWILYAAGRYWIYFDGNDGSNLSIGLYTSVDLLTWTNEGQIVGLGGGGDPDQNRAMQPVVDYDGSRADSAKFLMWYGAEDGSNVRSICLAYSSDGFTWTKYASNPVVDVGGGGAWDEAIINPDALYKDGSTSYLIYEGFPSGTATSSLGVVSFTDHFGTYTKSVSNPLLQARTSAHTALTGNLNTGTKTVTIANTSIFKVNEFVFVDDSNSVEEINRVVSIDNATTLTLRDNVTSSFTTGQNANIRTVYQKVTARSVYDDDGDSLTIHGTAFGALSVQREAGVRYRAASITSGWKIDFNAGNTLTIMQGATGQWDYTSSENASVLFRGVEDDKVNPNEYTAFTSNVRIDSNLSLGSAPSAWGVGRPALQVNDLSIHGKNNNNEIDWNLYFDTGFKYKETAEAIRLWEGNLIDGQGNLGIGFAPSGTAGTAATVTTKFAFLKNGNLVIANDATTVTKPTSAVGTIILKIGTAPASSPTDQATIYVADGNGAGTACVHVRTEEGHIIELRQQANISDPSGGVAQDAESRTAINAILDILENNGLMAP